MPPVEGAPATLPGTTVDMAPPPPTLAWTVPIPAAPIVSPLVTADRVILAHLPGIVTAFDRTDGRELWHMDVSPEQPLATDGTLLFVHAAAALHAVRTSDGTLAWRVPSGKLTAPLVVKDGWIVGPGEGTLTARRANDGSVVWTVEAPAQHEPAAISGDLLFVPSEGGHLVARSLLNGQMNWDSQLGGDANEPFVVGDDVFVGAADKRFYCVDARTGDIEWTVRVGAAVRGRAATDGDRIFFAAFDNLVQARDRANGAERWHAGVPFRPVLGPVVAAGSIFVAGPGTELRRLSASDGRAAGTIALPGRQALAPGYAASGAGVVFAAVTGNLQESWNLSLTMPMPVGAPASR